MIKNTLHVTVSGLYATVYFMRGSEYGMPPNPTLGAFKRYDSPLSLLDSHCSRFHEVIFPIFSLCYFDFRSATTTSFGSICLGSLLVAILQTIRTLLRSIRYHSTPLPIPLPMCLYLSLCMCTLFRQLHRLL